MERKQKFPKWEMTSKDEQEVVINIEYVERKVTVFVRKKSAAYQLYKKLGEPTKLDTINGLVFSMEWVVSFDDIKKISKIFAFRNFIDKSIA